MVRVEDLVLGFTVCVLVVRERGGAAEPDRGAHADWTHLSMKQEIMAEGPRCKRRKQANPRRKNGKTTRTRTHQVPQTLLRGVPARPPARPGREVPACVSPGRDKRVTKVLKRDFVEVLGAEREEDSGPVCDGAGPGPRRDPPGGGGRSLKAGKPLFLRVRASGPRAPQTLCFVFTLRPGL